MNEEAVVKPTYTAFWSAFQAIRAIDYTVVFVRDMAAMRRFYEDILVFHWCGELSPGGSNIGWQQHPGLGQAKLTAADAPNAQRQRLAAGWHSRFPLPKSISAPTNFCGRGQSAFTAH